MMRRVLRRGRHEQSDLTDEQLTERARAGDNKAFGELFRRHRKAAEWTARRLLRSRADADDVVSEAFAGVLAAIRSGNGPHNNFRRYLLACVRNGCRARRPLVLAGHAEAGTDARTFQMFEDPERYVEADTVARAFASLRPRWQQTLWLTEVEQFAAAEVADQMRLAPNAAAALTHRAREAFATAYLAEHARTAANEICARYRPQLAAYVRDQLTDAQRADVERHVVTCPHCEKAVDDLRDVNSSLRTLAPAPGAAVGSGVAAQVTITGSSIGGSSAGLFGGGLLLKAAALLVIAPVIVANSPGRNGAEPATRTVDAADAESSPDAVAPFVAPAFDVVPSSVVRPTTTTTNPVVDDVAGPTVRPPAIGPVDRPIGVPPTTDRVTSTVTTVATTSPVPDVAPLEPLAALVDGVLTDVVTPLVDGLVTEVVVPLVDGVVTEVVPVVGAVGGIVGDAVTIVDDATGTLGVPVADDAVQVVDDVLGGGGIGGELLDPDLRPPADPDTPTTTPTSPSPTSPQLPSAPSTAAPGPSTTSPAPPPTTAPPAPTLPALTVPPVSIPPVTLPLNLPPVTLPVISIAPITVPDLLGG